MKLCSAGKSTPNRHSVKAHCHSDWEFVYNIRGNGITTVGDQSYPFEPGTVLLIPPQVYHDKVTEAGFEDIFFHFSGFESPHQIYFLKDTYDRRLLQLMQLLHSTYYDGSSPSVSSSLCDAILALVRPMLSGMEQSAFVQQLRLRIADSYTDPDFSLRAAMDTVPVNRDHLRRLFVKETGQTPHGYLSQLRLGKAKRLLSDGHSTVAEVAYRCGYYDALYFSKVFRSAVGIPPSQWR